MEEQRRINKQNHDKPRDDDTTDFPVRIGMLGNAKTRWEKDSYSRNVFATEYRRVY